MQKKWNIGIVGATGAVGKEILHVLEKRSFPVDSLRLFASERSAGQTLIFKNTPCRVESLTKSCFQGLDIVFFSAGSKISLEFAPYAKEYNAIVIDNSSAFRQDPDIPLVIPEVNPHALQNHKGIISNPNCAAIIMLLALAPLHKKARIKRIVAATYQAASGAGASAMKDLEEETKAYFTKQPYTRTVVPHPYAFNLFLHNSALNDNGYVDEELKMLNETRKILEDDSIRLTATCVRVPILRAHSEALNVEFHSPLSAKEASDILKHAQGLTILEDKKNNRFPMPIDAIGQDDVYCGRIRDDLSQANTLDLWVVGDQLLKGAALNAVQIAETLVTNSVPSTKETVIRS